MATTGRFMNPIKKVDVGDASKPASHRACSDRVDDGALAPDCRHGCRSPDCGTEGSIPLLHARGEVSSLPGQCRGRCTVLTIKAVSPMTKILRRCGMDRSGPTLTRPTIRLGPEPITRGRRLTPAAHIMVRADARRTFSLPLMAPRIAVRYEPEAIRYFH